MSYRVIAATGKSSNQWLVFQLVYRVESIASTGKLVYLVIASTGKSSNQCLVLQLVYRVGSIASTGRLVYGVMASKGKTANQCSVSLVITSYCRDNRSRVIIRLLCYV